MPDYPPTQTIKFLRWWILWSLAKLTGLSKETEALHKIRLSAEVTDYGSLAQCRAHAVLSEQVSKKALGYGKWYQVPKPA